MSDDYLTQICVLLSAFGVSAFAGLAALMRFSSKISKVGIISTILNSGFMGLAIALIWYQNYRQAENIFGLLGICVLAGLGGSTIADLVMSIISGAGVHITVRHEHHRNEVNNDDDKNP